jgi:hypothetical protein
VSRLMASRLIPLGLLLMSATLLYHNRYHNEMDDRFSEFVVGALRGLSIGLMLAGAAQRRPHSNCCEESRRSCDSA